MADRTRAAVTAATRDLAAIGALNAEALDIIQSTDDPAALREVVRILARAVRSVGHGR